VVLPLFVLAHACVFTAQAGIQSEILQSVFWIMASARMTGYRNKKKNFSCAGEKFLAQKSSAQLFRKNFPNRNFQKEKFLKRVSAWVGRLPDEKTSLNYILHNIYSAPQSKAINFLFPLRGPPNIH
jgi:hypothetical protein